MRGGRPALTQIVEADPLTGLLVISLNILQLNLVDETLNQGRLLCWSSQRPPLSPWRLSPVAAKRKPAIRKLMTALKFDRSRSIVPALFSMAWR